MSISEPEFLNDLVELAGELAASAAHQTLQHFRSTNLSTDNKLAGAEFDPVTQADRGAERVMREILSAKRPDDGVFGEEQARTYGNSGLTWVLDPIDGTRAFISGLPTWGTLIGLDDGTSGRIGIIDQPYLDERFIGVMGGKPVARLQSRGAEREITTRRGVALGTATVFTTDPYLFHGAEYDAFTEVRKKARLTRYGLDCYAYALLAMGQIDAVIESGLQAYDIAAHVPLIRAAGGVVTSWNGGDCRWGGQVLAAGSPELHAEILDILKHAAGPDVVDA